MGILRQDLSLGGAPSIARLIKERKSSVSNKIIELWKLFQIDNSPLLNKNSNLLKNILLKSREGEKFRISKKYLTSISFLKKIEHNMILGLK